MNYTRLVIPPSVQRLIQEYLEQRYPDNPELFEQAKGKIHAELNRVERTPDLGTPVPEGPFENGRRTSIIDVLIPDAEGENVHHWVNIAYSEDTDRGHFVLTDFRPVAF